MFTELNMAQSGDKTARDVFFEKNMGLVKSIARRFTGRGTDFEDLCQIGSIGLIKAIDRFNIESGNSFSTYAVPVITGEIKRFLRDDGMIKVSRSVKELGIKANIIKQKLEREGEDVSVSELAGFLGVSVSELVPALDYPWEVYSLNVPDEEGREKINKLVSCNTDCETRVFVNELIDLLPEKDKKLVFLRYFCGKTQSETAKELGISQVQVSRREKNALKLLRESVK